jgi:4-amino-4-deoxy-L-arabinose transferase-like glycosyltransferase
MKTRSISSYQPSPLQSNTALRHSWTRAWLASWPMVALGGVLLLSAVLLFARLGSQGFGNLYYAASIQSMLKSWHNFFFVAFDSAGFLAVDKPPLALWAQAASVKLFGWNPASLMLPQALSALLSVAVLFHVVRRSFGATAGVLAALVLALTPIAVATGRNNTMDSMLVLVLLLAVWSLRSAVQTGKLPALLLTGLWIGIGFNIKMTQALLVLPAFCVWYVAAAPLPRKQQIINLVLAGAVMALVSLPWILAVDLTPASARPFVASSSNSEVDLVIGHNGGLRIMGNPFKPSEPLTSYVTDEIGAPGPLRLWQRQLGGQASWLIPLALLGALVALWPARQRDMAVEQFTTNRPAILMWATWLVTAMLFFTVGHKFHRYYMVMLAPPIAALVGAGLVALWRAFSSSKRAWLVLPLALLVTAAVQMVMVAVFPAWGRVLIPVIGALVLIAAGALIWLHRRGAYRQAAWALALGVFALLVAPATWAVTPLLAVHGPQPFAGPDLFIEGTSYALPQLERLTSYLNAHQQGTRFLVATTRANTAAPLILETGQPVMTFGGYSGGDEILTPRQFAARVAAHDVQFVLLPASTDQQRPIVGWVATNCRAVPPAQWRAPNDPADQPLAHAFGEAYQLFDCGNTQP